MVFDAPGAVAGIVPEARRLIGVARQAYAGQARVSALLADCARRLDEPLRVALAGQLKAGKSTLLNALVGQDIAPTDATECTRLVTWYRHGPTPRVTAFARDGAHADVGVRRDRGADGLATPHGLHFDLSALRWNAPGAREVDHLDVQWPSEELARTTIIDSPGISSMSREVSARTARLLTPAADPAGVVLPGADAVVYLLRRLDAADVNFLESIGAGIGSGQAADAGVPGLGYGAFGAGASGTGRFGHGTTGTGAPVGAAGAHGPGAPPAGYTAAAAPLGAVGVVSRADEIGAGRIDALHSAREVASRFAEELERTGLCQSVVPVAGLLAFAAATLRQREYSAFEALATVPTEELTAALLSADRFARPDLPLPVSPELRAHLVARFGLFGIRLSVTLIRLGVRDSASLAAELTSRSGLDELRSVLDVQFAQRAEELKAHSALTALARILAAYPGTSADALLPRVRTLLADVHGFAELRLLGRLRSDELPLPEDDIAELQRLIGGSGVAPHLRLGLPADTDLTTQREYALAAVRKWRSRAGHPLADQVTATACLTAARSAEGLLDTLNDPPTTPLTRIPRHRA
ncbi:Predicted GTPase [Nocardia otitidiscaviarum]|uniref:Predicted GTPase n=1 Tax=Nocardia otitidiscaviarum TaxID=1823 RepID=A0A378YBK2_9NOCA|nr:dynamin family protein [Nocardia otitidiscaviarum]SUA74093.1 Predicted GTPase [Nocardia otitidiscaviarum]